MIPYFAVFVILSVFALMHFVRIAQKIRVPLVFINAIFLICFAGFRGVGVGTDDLAYVRKFLEIPDFYSWLVGEYTYSFMSVKMEPLYIATGSFVRIFTDNYVFLFLSNAILSVGLAVYNYNRYSKFVFLTILLFFVHTYLYRDLNQVRSAIAASIALFLIVQIHERQHLKIIVTILLASMFHIAAFTLSFAYLLSFFKVTRFRVFISYIVSLLLGMIGASSLVFFIIPETGFFAEKLHSYTTSEKFVNTVGIFDLTNIKNSMILILLLIFWEKLYKKVPYFAILVLFYSIAVGIRIAFWDLGVIAARTSTFFAIVEVILIPYFVLLFKNKLLVTLIIIFYAFLMLYLNFIIKGVPNSYSFSFMYN